LIAIKTENLGKKYGSLVALDNLNLEVPEKVVFGFLGPNGAGKSTTVKLLTGFSRPTSGMAWVAGQKVDAANLELRRRIGFLPDVPAFYDWMSGREVMNYCGSLFQLPAEEAKRRVDDLLILVGINKSASRRVGSYSRGMRQRLGIAQALINRPAVLFMDEPTSALDPIGRKEILELILQLKQTTTIFMSTHILSDVERVCDMVGIVNQGQLMTVDTITELRNQYARSMFEMEFIENPASLMDTLQKIPWLTSPHIVDDKGHRSLQVKATDLERARHELPGIISQSGLTLTRYEMVMPDLEDIFMDIVKRGELK
jgi:ABC-2 type transport system ATP-binding protein